MIRSRIFWSRRATIIGALVGCAGRVIARPRGGHRSVEDERRRDQSARAAADRRRVLQGRDRRAASAALDDAIKACPTSGRSFALRPACTRHRSSLWRRRGVPAARDSVRRQDGSTMVAARRQASKGCALADRRRLPLAEFCGRHFLGCATSSDRSPRWLFSWDGTAAALYLYQIVQTGELRLLRRTTFGSRVTAIAFSRQRKPSSGWVQRPKGSRGRARRSRRSGD